jgi:signal transduction histidine kinase
MRRTLTLSYLVLMILLLLALEIPLVYSSAMDEFHHLLIARSTEAARFAAAAEPVLSSHGDSTTLLRQIQQYDHSLGVQVLLVDARGRPVLASRSDVRVSDPAWRSELRQALAGGRPDSLDYPFNVSAIPLFVVQPVQEGNQVLGAVATISPTTDLRSTMIGRLVIYLAVGLLGLLAAIAVAVPLSRWILRPVCAVSASARAIADGHYDERAPVDDGPPELRVLSSAVNTMADRLVTLLRAQKAFVADASHQLRNPLTALRLRVEALEPMVTDEGQESLGIAVTEVERLSNILAELLALASAEGSAAETTVIDAHAVARGRADAWRSRAGERGVHIAVTGSSTTALAVSGTLDQALDVLLDNALHVSSPDSQITVRLVERDTEVDVHVTDQGPGMAEADRTRAFDRFWRGSTSADRDGSGLGLAIALALVTSSGGRLRLDPATPCGVDAVVTLPAAQPADVTD